MTRLRSRSALVASVSRVQPRRRARRPTWVSTTTPSGVPRHAGLRDAAQGFRFRVEEAGRPDDLLQLSWRGGGQGRDIRQAAKELWGDHVDARVGALRRENGRNEELERAPEVE